jgi:hypothetical protein
MTTPPQPMTVMGYEGGGGGSRAGGQYQGNGANALGDVESEDAEEKHNQLSSHATVSED